MRETVLDRSRYKNYRAESAPDDFHHVAWKTMKYDEMLNFYSTLFDCEPLYTSEGLSFLTFDEEHHRFAIINTSAALENLGWFPKLMANSLVSLRNFVNRITPNLVGLDHISYKMDSIEGWFNFYHKAKEKGMHPAWTINHGWISGIYYRDPDGHLVEVFYEHFRSAEEFRTTDAISPDFAEEPIGTNMDIDVLYEMYKSGTPFEELIVKGNTVPEGKKPVSGMEAVMNMRKKFK